MAVLYPCTTCEHNSNGCCTQFKGCGKYRRWLKTKCQRSADEMTAEIKEKEAPPQLDHWCGRYGSSCTGCRLWTDEYGI